MNPVSDCGRSRGNDKIMKVEMSHKVIKYSLQIASATCH